MTLKHIRLNKGMTYFGIAVMILIIVVISILGFYFLSVKKALNTRLPKQARVPIIDESNAAYWYEEALSLVQIPTEEQKEALSAIIKSGWNTSTLGIEDYINLQKEAVALFKKGAGLAECDFLYGMSWDPFDSTLPYPFPEDLGRIGPLVNVIVAQGRLYESKNEIGKAINNYMTVARFAGHITEKHPTLLGKMIEYAVIKDIYHPLIEILTDESVNEDHIDSILKQIKDLRRKSPSFVKIMTEFEFAFNSRHVQVSMGVTSEEYLKPFEAIDKRFLDYFLNAYHERKPEQFGEKLESLMQKANRRKGILWFFKDIPQIFSKGPTTYAAELSAELLAAISIPNMVSAMNTSFMFDTKKNLILTAASLRRYELAQNSIPDNLDRLVPKYLTKIPKDLFTVSGNLNYYKEKDGWKLYSVGPDRIDQKGQEMVEGDDPSGDIVVNYLK